MKQHEPFSNKYQCCRGALGEKSSMGGGGKLLFQRTSAPQVYMLLKGTLCKHACVQMHSVRAHSIFYRTSPPGTTITHKGVRERVCTGTVTMDKNKTFEDQDMASLGDEGMGCDKGGDLEQVKTELPSLTFMGELLPVAKNPYLHAAQLPPPKIPHEGTAPHARSVVHFSMRGQPLMQGLWFSSP